MWLLCASWAASGGAWPRPRRKNAPEDGLLGREVLEAHGGPASPEGPWERPRSEGLVDTRPTGPARRVARLSGKPGLLCVVGWGADGGQGLDEGTLGRHTETGRLAREATEDREPLRAHGREVAKGGRAPPLAPSPPAIASRATLLRPIVVHRDPGVFSCRAGGAPACPPGSLGVPGAGRCPG